MDLNRWQQIEDIFHQAIELPGPSRSKFVEAACRESPEIRQEVFSLLDQHVEDSKFLERSPVSGIVGDLTHAAQTLAGEISDSIYGSKIGSQSSVRCNRIDESELPALIESLGGQYRFRRLIGQGGMGAVVQVYDQALEREVALKIIASHDLDDQLQRSIIRESQAAAKVKSDHIVNIHTVSQNETVPFLVMELVDGPSLRTMIDQDQQLAPNLAAEIARQIAIGLDDAHRVKLIHRDIKPANVLLENVQHGSTSALRAKIIDFGLALVTGDEWKTADSHVAGTPAYMSPEQLFSPSQVDPRSDVYGLGATLYEMLTGDPPYRGAAHRVIRQIETTDPVPPRQLDDQLPRDLESICLKALSKDPLRRYQTAGEMADDLKRFQDGKPTRARPLSTLKRTWRWYRRNTRVALFAAAAAVALTGFALGSLWFAITVSRKNQEITLHQTEAQQARIQTVLDAQPAALPLAIANLNRDENAIFDLESEFDNQMRDSSQRLNAAMALSLLGQPQTEYIVSMIGEVFESPEMSCNIIDSLTSEGHYAIKLIRSKLEQLNKTATQEVPLQAKFSIVALHLGNFADLSEIAQATKNPGLQTEIIHEYQNWHGDLDQLIDQLGTDKRGNWVVCQMLGLINPRSLRPALRDRILSELDRVQQQTRFHCVYASACWSLRQWQFSPTVPTSADKSNSASSIGSRDWEVLKTEGLTDVELVTVAPSVAMLGRLDKSDQFEGYPPHRVKLTRPFAIGNSEITVGQFRTFLNDDSTPDSDKPAGFKTWLPDQTTSPSDLHPVQNVSWNDAVLFCNWLSRTEGYTPCYRRNQKPLVLEVDDDKSVNLENWICDFEANGFRLPTEAEWEMACRAGSTTRYFFGDDPEYLNYYGLASNNRSMSSSPFQVKMPNSLGMFDMHGNVWEWCHDWHSYLNGDDAIDPRGPELPDVKTLGRVYRGGGIATLSGDTNSSSRGHAFPDTRFPNLGFRIARTKKQQD